MAKTNRVSQTKTTNKKPNNDLTLNKNHLFVFGAAFMGVAIGVIASLAMVLPMARAEFAAQAKQLDSKIVSMSPASATLTSCSVPTGAVGSQPQVLGESTTAAPALPGGSGGGGVVPTAERTIFVKKIVGGVFAHSSGTISNTGPDSTNEIKNVNIAKTTVTNNNEVTISNSNTQSASSGNATVSDNTTGGNAVSGDSTNTSNNQFNLKINN